MKIIKKDVLDLVPGDIIVEGREVVKRSSGPNVIVKSYGFFVLVEEESDSKRNDKEKGELNHE